MTKNMEAKVQAIKDIREELNASGKSFIAISMRQWKLYQLMQY